MVNFSYKYLTSQYFSKFPLDLKIDLNYTAWTPAEKGIIQQPDGCVEHFCNKLKAKAPLNLQTGTLLEKSKLYSQSDFMNSLLPPWEEAGVIFFHFTPLSQALSLTFPCLSLFWMSAYCMVSNIKSQKVTRTTQFPPFLLISIILACYQITIRKEHT